MIVIKHVSQSNKPLVQVFFDTGIGVERVYDMSTGPTQTTPPIVPKALNFAWGEHCCVYYVYVIYNGNDKVIQFRYLSYWLGDMTMWWTVL